MAKKSSKNVLTIPKFVKDLTTNKYFLYIVAFFAVINVLGYMAMGKNICVLLFILIALVTSYFSKNMIFVLAVPTFLVGFFAICDTIKQHEGFSEGVDENEMFQKGDEIMNSESMQTGKVKEILDDKIVLVDGTEIPMEEIEEWSIVESLIEGNNHEETDKKDEDKKDKHSKSKKGGDGDVKPSDGEGAGKKNGFRSAGKKGDRIDYATTLEDAYSNLNNMIGKDGIKNLTRDTQALMNQQLQLASAMKGMQPLIGQAKEMMNSLGEFGDLGKLTQGLNLKQ